LQRQEKCVCNHPKCGRGRCGPDGTQAVGGDPVSIGVIRMGRDAIVGRAPRRRGEPGSFRTAAMAVLEPSGSGPAHFANLRLMGSLFWPGPLRRRLNPAVLNEVATVVMKTDRGETRAGITARPMGAALPYGGNGW